MAAPKKKVNLLIKEGFEYSTAGRILTWALSAGRIIVILTELVVIMAFISRFWLDRTLTDLHESNTAKRRQIEASAKFETEFRQAQERISNFKKLATTTDAAGHVRRITPLLPSGVTLTKFTFAKAEFVLSGVTLSEAGLAGFMKALGSNTQYKDITLTNLTLNTDGRPGMSFTLKGNFTDASTDKTGGTAKQ